MKEEKKQKKQQEKGKQKYVEPIKKKNVVSTRGRIFQGTVIRKFQKRITIEFQRTIKIPKYERFLKKRTRLHARLPDEMFHDIHLGDLVQIQECRPLSKIIHFVVIKKIKSTNEEEAR